jgi:hypothetical protein
MIGSSGIQGIVAKVTRGLLYNQPAYDARVGLFDVGELLLATVPVKAGQETAVPVAVPGLPANADVHKLTAKLQVGRDGSAEQTATASVEEVNGPKRTFKIGADAQPGLRNVQVRLQGGAPIWNHAGAVPADEYQLPDFAQQVNAYLEQAKIKDDTVLQFLVKSDVDGSVAIKVDPVDPSSDFTLLQTQSWKNDLDSTFRIDRNLTMEFNSIEKLPLDSIAGNITRSAVSLEAKGQFGPERLLGEVESWDGRENATVSPDYSVAQLIELNSDVVKKSVQAAGIVVYIESGAAAEVYVELQQDASGVPASGAPMAKSNVSYKPPDKGAKQQWTLASFEQQAALQLSTPYWVVVKAVRGNVRLGLRAQIPADQKPVVLRPITMINRGGDHWVAMAPDASSDSPRSTVAALTGVIYRPEPDNQTAAIQLTIETSASEQHVEPGSQPKPVVLDLKGDKRQQATLVVRSHAHGMLTVANLVQEYTVT